MKFILEKELKENIYNLMRKLGYHFQRQDNELVFYRPLSASNFPRFHLYIKKEGKKLIFSIHLDQKKPVYKGVTFHSGEYNSKIVKEELERIEQALR